MILNDNYNKFQLQINTQIFFEYFLTVVMINYLQISVYNVLLMTVMHSRNNLNTVTTSGVNNNIQKYKQNYDK